MNLNKALLLVIGVLTLQQGYAQTNQPSRAVGRKNIKGIIKDSIANLNQAKETKKINNAGQDQQTPYLRKIDHAYFDTRLAIFQNDQQLQLREFQLRELLADDKSDARLVTQNNYNTIIRNNFRTLSGTEIKNGKYLGSSATVDSKSITVNFSLKPIKEKEIYLLPTVAGSAKDGFTTLISGNKYSRTITGGLNFIALYPNNKSNFTAETRSKLHNDLKLLEYNYDRKLKADGRKFFNDAISEVKDLLLKNGDFIYKYYTNDISVNEPDSQQKIDQLNLYKKDIDTLIKANVLPKDFSDFPVIEQQIILHFDFQQEAINQAVLNQYLTKADKAQQKAVFAVQRLTWFGGGVKYNQANYSVLDASSTDLVKSVRDEYVSANLSMTVMWIQQKGSRVYISPTLNLQNNHNFNSKNQIHTQIFQNYVIGSTTTQQITKDITFYPNTPNRLTNLYFDLPVAYYNLKHSLGAELGFKVGMNDVDNDNRSIRLGLLVPINPGDKNQLIIEPIFKAQKLNENVTDFWKNNFVFGINLSVTIPKSFFNQGS